MAASAKPPRPATYADLEALPPNVVGEIVHGVLHAHPRPAPPHAVATSRLGIEVGGPFDRGRGGPGGWWILDEPELHLHEEILVPDLAGWRRERLPEMPKRAWFDVAPDWVCEVLSPSTAAFDRATKLPVYARERISNLWLVDPIARTLEAFRLEQGRWSLLVTHADAAVARVEPFEAIELEVKALWGE